MHAGRHLGSHVGAHLGSLGAGVVVPPVDDQMPSSAVLVRLGAMYGLLERADVFEGSLAVIDGLFGLLQQIGPIMIEVTGPSYVFRGDSVSYRLTVTDDAGARTNLTGWAVEFQVKREIGDADPPLISKAVGSGIVLLAQSGDTKGQADITITKVDTDIAPGGYVRDVVVSKDAVRAHVIDPQGFVIRGSVNLP